MLHCDGDESWCPQKMMKVLVLQKSYGGSEVLEIETRIRLIQQHSTSFVFEGHDSDPQIYTQYHSGLNYPSGFFFKELQAVIRDQSSCARCWCCCLSLSCRLSRRRVRDLQWKKLYSTKIRFRTNLTLELNKKSGSWASRSLNHGSWRTCSVPSSGRWKCS